MRSKLRLHKHLCDSRQPTSWESCSLLTHIKPMWDFILLLRVKQILKNCSTGHSSQMHKELVFYLQLYWEITKFKGRSWENPVKSTKLLDYLLPNTSVYCLQHWRVLQEIKKWKIQTRTCGCKELFFFFFFCRESDLGCYSGFCVYIHILEWALTQDGTPSDQSQFGKCTKWGKLSTQRLYPPNIVSWKIITSISNSRLTHNPGRDLWLRKKLLYPFKCTSSTESSSPQVIFDTPTQRKHNSSLLITYSLIWTTYPQ